MTELSIEICELLFSHYIAVGQHKIDFDAKVEAIKFTLEQFTYRINKYKKAVFLVDSKATIQAIASNNNQ